MAGVARRNLHNSSSGTRCAALTCDFIRHAGGPPRRRTDERGLEIRIVAAIRILIAQCARQLIRCQRDSASAHAHTRILRTYVIAKKKRVIYSANANTGVAPLPRYFARLPYSTLLLFSDD